MIKVLHIIKSLGRGGAEMLLPETLAFHNKRSLEFHYIYFLPWKNQMVSAIREQGGKVSCFSANNNVQIIRTIPKIIKYINENGIQLIHCHLPWAGFCGRFIHFKTGLPVLYTEHNKQERYHFITRTINKLTFNYQSHVVAVSDDVAKSIQTNIHPKLPVSTILNGVNIEKFQRSEAKGIQLRKSLGISSGDFVIGTIAVFRFQKRLDVWLEVFADLKKRHTNLKGIIVGDGILKDKIQKKRTLLGLDNDVIMPGLQTNTVDWLSALDLYMMSSVFEGLPVALLEAMSCNLPVVSTNAGGISEVIRNERDGVVVPVSSTIEQLSDAAHKLILNRIDRDRFGAAARERVVSSFSMQQMVQQLENLYFKLLKYDHSGS
jgi:glycosyltransferase involved in cell wall biosynthesis